MSARPPAEDVAIQLAIDEGLEVAETKLQTRIKMAEEQEAKQHAVAALSVLRKRQCRVDGSSAEATQSDGGGR